jgi:hypothetical protein
MKGWERRVYLVSMVLTIAATALALAPQTTRVTGILERWPITGVLFLPGVIAFYATPVLAVWGIGYSLALSWRMASREQAHEGKPSLYIFVVCALVWLFVWYTFKLFPLFVGESRVERVFIDGWLDKLL